MSVMSEYRMDLDSNGQQWDILSLSVLEMLNAGELDGKGSPRCLFGI